MEKTVEEEYKEKVQSRIYEAFKNDLPNTFESNVKEFNEYENHFIHKCFHTALNYRNFNFISSVLCYHKYFNPDFSFDNYSLLIKFMKKTDSFYFEDISRHIDYDSIDINEFIFFLFNEKILTTFFINRINQSRFINYINPQLKNIISKKPIDIKEINKQLETLNNIKNF